MYIHQCLHLSIHRSCKRYIAILRNNVLCACPGSGAEVSFFFLREQRGGRLSPPDSFTTDSRVTWWVEGQKPKVVAWCHGYKFLKQRNKNSLIHVTNRSPGSRQCKAIDFLGIRHCQRAEVLLQAVNSLSTLSGIPRNTTSCRCFHSS
jgi:hypothetical protein